MILPDWTAATVAIIGTGPSLEQAQIDAVRAAGMRLVAVGRSYELVPMADLVVVRDPEVARRQWHGYVARSRDFCIWPDLHNGTATDIALIDPELPLPPSPMDYQKYWLWRGEIENHWKAHPCPSYGRVMRCWQRRAGAVGIEIAMRAGSTRLVLIGFDGGIGLGFNWQHHFYTSAPLPPGIVTDDDEVNATCWPALARKAERLGVRILNASPTTRIEAFERMPLSAAIGEACLSV